MKNFGKVFSLVVISLSLLLLVLNTPVHALVIAAPLIAISAFKAGVFLVSVMSIPTAILIKVLKRWGTMKTCVVSLIILGLIFSVVYGMLAMVRENSSNKTTGRRLEYVDGFSVAEPPLYYNRITGSKVAVGRPVERYFRVLMVYAVLTVASAVILLIPIVIILVVIGKARNEDVRLGRIVAISGLVGTVIALPLAFCLGIIYAVTSGSIVVY